ncbi:MAG: T9SS type A sorting domain-containing protein, partial [Bacteroidales bacterium]|nr:T9SS type A sorting domain-containing protein [Bacteroidales bacterium]
EEKMPELIVPSSWSHDVTIDWLQSVNKQENEHEAFSIASTHNTGGNYLGETLVNQAKRVEAKEIWSTELHEWGGVESSEEIKNSSILWRHIRDGFNGFATWLFYGNYAGRFHAMLWTHPNKGIRKSTKYEIFKKLVNNTNRGYYLHTPPIHSNVHTAAFVRGNFLNVWVLNNSDVSFDSLTYNLESFHTEAHVAKEIRWNAQTPRSGMNDAFIPGSESVTRNIAPHSLYSFKVKLTEPVEGGYDKQPRDTLSGISLSDTVAIQASGFVDGVYQGNLPALADSVLPGWDKRNLNVTQVPEPGTTVQGRGNKVVLKASNQKGDTTRVHVRVNVLADTEKPTVKCISDTTVYVNTDTVYTVAGDEFAPADTSDNTSIVQLTNNITGTQPLEGTTLPLGTTAISWIAKDIAGNQNYCRFDVTVEEKITGNRRIRKSKISVYPNPVIRKVYFHSEERSVHSVSLTDLTGKLLLRKTNVGTNGSIDLSWFESGIYLFRVKTGKKVYTKKVVKN